MARLLWSVWVRFHFALMVAVGLFQASFPISVAEADERPPPMTSVKDQGMVGFCWSYASHALLESQALKRGKRLDLSEEYIGFYWMLAGIRNNLPWLKLTATDSPQARSKLWRWFVHFILKPPQGIYEASEAFSLFSQYGVVPESAYRFKVTKESHFEKNVRRFFDESLSVRSKLREYERDPLLLQRDFMIAIGAPPLPFPNQSFVYRGKQYTPRSFLQKVVRPQLGPWVQLSVSAQSEAGTALDAFKALRATLDEGVAVPLGFVVYAEAYSLARKTATFSARACPEGKCKSIIGGHMVLATQWDVSKGILVKNSQGTNVGVDARGAFPKKDQSGGGGYYWIAWDYLEKSDLPWQIAIPSRIARAWNLKGEPLAALE